MAERVVIAKLEVDEKGVVKSYKAAGTAAKKMGAKTSQAGKKMQQNMQQAAGGVEKNMGQMLRSMFALSTAATALFSISIFVRSIKEFAVEILKSAEGMEETAAAATLLKEEISEFIRNLIDGSGVLRGWVDHLIIIVALWELMNDKAKVAREESTLINAALREAVTNLTFGMSVGFGAAADQIMEELADRIKRIRMDIERTVIAADKWVSSLIKIKQYGPFAGIASFDPFHGAIGARFDPFLKGPPPAETIEGTFLPGPPSQMQADVEFATVFRDVMLEVKGIIEETLEPLEAMGEELDTTAVKLQIVAGAGAAAGAALAQAFLEGGISLGEALASVLKQVSTAMFVKAGEYLALGFAALTPWGRMVLGPAPPYFKASGMFAAAGAAAGTAGIAVGGRGSGGAGAVGGEFTDTQAFPAQRSQSVTIVVEGSVIGTSPDKLAREIEGLLRTARSDGA